MEKIYFKNQIIVDGNPIDPRNKVENESELKKYNLYSGLPFFDESQNQFKYVDNDRTIKTIATIEDVSILLSNVSKPQNGLTPYIGDDGNWWIGTTNTGVCAENQTLKNVKFDSKGVNFHHSKLDKDVSISWEQLYDLIKKED